MYMRIVIKRRVDRRTGERFAGKERWGSGGIGLLLAFMLREVTWWLRWR